MRHWTRALPALAVVTLLGVALLVSFRARASAPGSGLPYCEYSLQQQLGFTDTLVAYPGSGVLQPIGEPGNVVACSLAVQMPTYSSCVVSLQQWDPVGLAPDPSTVALRSISLNPSALQYNGTRLRIDYPQPIVARTLTGVAEPPTGSLAYSFQCANSFQSVPTWIFYSRDGSSSVPATRVIASGGDLVSLPGAHPVASHVICGGDPANQDRYVLQSVMTTDTTLDGSVASIAQKFRVPSTVEVQWVEFAFPDFPQVLGQLLSVGIFDATGQPYPPLAPANPLAASEADLWSLAGATWSPMPAFDQPVTLLPGHDYWLVANTRNSYRIKARMGHGSESLPFRSGIGVMFTRPSATGAWSPRPEMNLSFRLIGTASTVTAVTPPSAPRTAFALRVSPNPAAGAAFVEWRDAHGPVRIDVLDAHGRRVGGGDGAAASGRWLWSAPRAGDARAAGVYFVRATDGEGRVAVERFVRVR